MIDLTPPSGGWLEFKASALIFFPKAKALDSILSTLEFKASALIFFPKAKALIFFPKAKAFGLHFDVRWSSIYFFESPYF
jgi:hypothetical protein